MTAYEKPEPSPPRYQLIADTLRNRIVTGELGPGERLPAEPELMGEYGVSRSTWREAMRTLAAENLVVATRGVTGGTFVIEPSPGDLAKHLQVTLAILIRRQISISQLFEARYMLEIPAAGVAALHRTEQQIAHMRQTIEDVRHLSGADRWEANYAFHGTLLEASGNPLLVALLTPMTSVLRADIARRSRVPSGFWDEVCTDHEDILAAVETGDSTATKDAMQRHFENLEKAYDGLRRFDRNAGRDI